jgi:tetratricopeptide (TPR) repeat protein
MDIKVAYAEAAHLERQQRYQEAEAAYRQLAAAYPQEHTAWHALATLASRSGNTSLAAAYLEAAIAVKPASGLYHRDASALYRRLARHDLSLSAAKKAVKLMPADADAHYHLAHAYADTGDLKRAITHYRRALKLNPHHTDYSQALAEALGKRGQPDVVTNPNPPVLIDAALMPVRSLTHHTQSSLEAFHAKGIACYQQNRFEEAVDYFDAALAIAVDPLVLNSKGFALQDVGRMLEARDCFQQAVDIAPDLAIARLNLGLAQLKLGDWTNGWQNYEARWEGSAEKLKGKLSRQAYVLPVWSGAGETRNQALLVVGEQGLGDVIQMARYLPLLRQRFERVGFVAAPALVRLMESSFGDQVMILPSVPLEVSGWHWQCDMMSLPRAFATTPDTIPSDIPYLKVAGATSAHWKARLEKATAGRLRIGVAWAGRKDHHYDARRSMAIKQLLPILQDSRVTWVSLQKVSTEDAARCLPPEIDWLDWTPDLADFSDTAALVANLDLVISIDSSMVHLAGALGIPVWMLDRFDNEWRWLQDRTDSPWYPSLRIFRQPRFGDWDTVIADVREALVKLPAPRDIHPAPARNRLQHAPVPPATQQTLSIEQALQMASQHQVAGQLALAEKLLTQILQAQPAHPHALHLLGVVAFQAGNVAQAIQLICHAIEQAPDVALFHANLAEMYRRIGDLANATHHARQAIVCDPQSPMAYSNLGAVLLDDRQYADAEAAYQQALVLDPCMLQAMCGMGAVGYGRQQLAEAERWYRKVLALAPQHFDALINLAVVLIEQGWDDQAISVLEPSLTSTPPQPAALFALARAHNNLGRQAVARQHILHALQLRPEDGVLRQFLSDLDAKAAL